MIIIITKLKLSDNLIQLCIKNLIQNILFRLINKNIKDKQKHLLLRTGKQRDRPTGSGSAGS